MDRPPERKTNRRCNWCGEPLNENSPNWFQCSEKCREEKWKASHPPKPSDEEIDR